jgi:hypothetical protein
MLEQFAQIAAELRNRADWMIDVRGINSTQSLKQHPFRS